MAKVSREDSNSQMVGVSNKAAGGGPLPALGEAGGVCGSAPPTPSPVPPFCAFAGQLPRAG